MKLSIIVANRNDLVMLNVTLNSALEAMKSLNFDSEIILVDNSDESFYNLMPVVIPHGWTKSKRVKMFRLPTPSFTAARMMAAKEAKGEYIFCIDSHVLVGRNTLNDAVNFMERHKNNKQLGFGHPPIRWCNQGDAAIRYTLGMAANGTPWGEWAAAPNGNKEGLIFWKFMPWICNREWYLNTLKGYGSHSTHSISWGGAELLQQLKSWMLGYEQWSIITDPIIHIGPFTPEVIKTGQYKYRVYGANGNKPHGFGVLLAFYVLGGDKDGYAHAKLCEDRIKQRHHISIDDYWPQVQELGKEEHEWLMENKKYGYLELLEKKPWLNQ